MRDVNFDFKYRVWNPVDNNFVEDAWIYSDGRLDHDTLPFHTLRKCIIQRYTGLKDLTGKEIYEGDTIRGLFDFGPAGFKELTLDVNWDNIAGYQWEYWDLNSIKVVSNTCKVKEQI